jgi:hypothetical protein
MRQKIIGLVSLLAPALVGALAGGACSSTDNPLADNPLGGTADKLCGPCGKLKTGDVGISGNAKLDGFFSAVAKLSDATASINGDFNANIDALSQVYAVEDFDASANIDTKVNNLIAAIKADFSANLDGGVTLNYTPAECHASVNVAVQAQAQCEAKAGCDAKVNPGEVDVQCEGECTGSCDGSCSGGVPTCEVDASATCEGKCEGSCTVEGGAKCDGVCHGECMGTCSIMDASGNCNGQCDGTCKGGCEASVAAHCDGTCSGKCEVSADAKCSGGEAPHCSGTCKGSCNANCTGKVTPPSASASCDATADCQAQASAQANASIECTPPSIDLSYGFKASADASAQADFMAHLSQLKVRGGAILQGFEKYDVIINGKKDASGNVIVKSPVVTLTASVQDLVNNAGSIAADVPVFRLGCAVDAFRESGKVLGDLATNGTADLKAQAKFAAAFTSGFSS